MAKKNIVKRIFNGYSKPKEVEIIEPEVESEVIDEEEIKVKKNKKTKNSEEND